MKRSEVKFKPSGGAAGCGITPRREVPGSISGRVLENIQMSYSFRPHSVALGSTQPLTEISTKEFTWG